MNSNTSRASRRPRAGLRGIPAILLLATLLPSHLQAAAPAPAAQITGASEQRPANEVSAILFETGGKQPMEARLAGLGSAFIPQLFQVLESGRTAVRVGEFGNSKRALDEAQEAAVLASFARLGRADVLAFLAGLVELGPQVGDRVAALRILGEMGRKEDLDLMNRLGRPPEGRSIVKKPVREAFADAFGRMLARDPAGMRGRLGVEFKRLHPSFAAPVVATIGRDPSFAGLRTLTGLLGTIPGTDAFVLVEIGRLGELLPHPLEPAVLDAVRPYLAGDDPRLLVEACATVGRLEDRDAVPPLTLLLQHRDANVRRTACEALVEITGKRLDAQPEEWEEWYRKSLHWWTRVAPGQFRTLRSGTPAEVTRVVFELSKKHYHRHLLTEPLAPLLKRSEPDLVVLTCAALGQLASPGAIPALTDCLAEHPDEEAKTAAWRALRRVTNRSLGPDARMWRQYADIQRRALQ